MWYRHILVTAIKSQSFKVESWADTDHDEIKRGRQVFDGRAEPFRIGLMRPMAI